MTTTQHAAPKRSTRLRIGTKFVEYQYRRRKPPERVKMLEAGNRRCVCRFADSIWNLLTAEQCTVEHCRGNRVARKAFWFLLAKALKAFEKRPSWRGNQFFLWCDGNCSVRENRGFTSPTSIIAYSSLASIVAGNLVLALSLCMLNYSFLPSLPVPLLHISTTLLVLWKEERKKIVE